MEFLLTIGIPSYNRSIQLKRLTKQLLKLKSKKIEFIFSDDCSSDNEVIKHLREFKEKDERVSLYENKTNLGITKNYYSTLQLAKGKYVMLLSNEDQIPINFEQVVLPLLEKNNYNAIFGFLKRPDEKDYLYNNEHPEEDISDIELIKLNYANIVFRGHISSQIYKKSKIDFKILEKISALKDNYWPIAPVTLMMMKTKNVLITNYSFVIVGADCVPETEISLKSSKKKKQIRHLFSLEKRADLYSYYIKLIIERENTEEFLKVLARYFIFFVFQKKRTGISQLKSINSIKKHEEVGKYFKEELRKKYFTYYFMFLKACINKYLYAIKNQIRIK